MKVHPVGDRLVIKPTEQPGAMASFPTLEGKGFILPTNPEQPAPETGRVMAMGPGMELEQGTVPIPSSDAGAIEIGDLVVFSRYGGTLVTYAGVEFLVVSGRDVYAVLEDPPMETPLEVDGDELAAVASG